VETVGDAWQPANVEGDEGRNAMEWVKLVVSLGAAAVFLLLIRGFARTGSRAGRQAARRIGSGGLTIITKGDVRLVPTTEFGAKPAALIASGGLSLLVRPSEGMRSKSRVHH
jgi:hypothetical protein